jgi:predicted ribosome quality control (RQC) complex YloA/Tae2 family protein
MKLSHLKQITQYLCRFEKINAIYRVADSVIKIVFDKDAALYFDMQRSDSAIFKTDEYIRSKVYNAPFDVMLAKRCNRSAIEHVGLEGEDKVLRFILTQQDAYKQTKSFLQFEFTGKNTNVIILDENETVLEALRHIDLFTSFREVRVGQKLLALPSAPFVAKEYPIEDVEHFLYVLYEQRGQKKLQAFKRQKIDMLTKKLVKLQKSYAKLENETLLTQEAQKNEHLGNLVLANLHRIKPYQKELRIKDYDGSELCIGLNELFHSAAEIAKYFFRLSKKAKQKAKNLHIERTSLEEKIAFFERFINIVANERECSRMQMLFPARKQVKKSRENEAVETFFLDGYKVQIGKNQRGNQQLLQRAKARDVWLHLKDRPSAHAIIFTDKQTVPQNVIEEAAKLCTDFSVFEKGRYLVDYTQRREVKVQEGANVLYNNYKTVAVDSR